MAGMAGAVLALIYLVIALVAAFWLTKLLLVYLLPFLLAVLFAALIEPLVGWMEERRVPRAVGALVGMVLVFGFISLIIVVAASRLVVELSDFTRQVPAYYQQSVTAMFELVRRLGEYTMVAPEPVQEAIRGQVGSLYGALQGFVRSVLGFISSLPDLVLGFIVTVIATFFLSRDKRAIGEFLLKLVPAGMRRPVSSARREILTSSLGFVKAQLTLVFLTGVFTAVGLAVVGAKYSVSLGMVAGLLDLFPMLGPSAVLLPWAAYSLLLGSKAFGVKLLVVLAVVVGARQLLEPRIVGQRIGLHPLATLLAIYFGIRFFGPLGFVIGPLAAILLRSAGRAGLLPFWPAAGERV